MINQGIGGSRFWDKAMFDLSAIRTKSKEFPCEDAEHLWSSRFVIRAVAKTYQTAGYNWIHITALTNHFKDQVNSGLNRRIMLLFWVLTTAPNLGPIAARFRLHLGGWNDIVSRHSKLFTKHWNCPFEYIAVLTFLWALATRTKKETTANC